MAQLRDSIVQGSLRVTDTLYSTTGYFPNGIKLINKSSAYNTENIIFANTDETKLSRIGVNTNGELGIFAYSSIVIKPACTGDTSSSEGIIVHADGIYPNSTASGETLGKSTNKWSNVYAVTFNGDLSGTASNITTTSDTSSELYMLGITSGATTTVKYNSGVKATNGAITATTYNGLILTAATTGFTIKGGTTAKTLTVGADYTLAAACAKGVTDSSSASAISTGTNLPTERDIYYGLPTINNSHAYTSSTTIYAPTSSGTSGYILKAGGENTAPDWIQAVPIANGGTGLNSADPHKVLIGPNGDTASAPTWRTIVENDLPYNGRIFYGTCATDAADPDKVVVCSKYNSGPTTGDMIIVKITADGNNSAAVANLTLNVNNTGAKPIKCQVVATLGNLPAVGYLLANGVYTFVYDGTNWVMMNVNRDNDNNTYTRQQVSTDSNNRSLLLSYYTVGQATSTTARTTYRNDAIYANASTGTIYATAFNGPLTGNSDTATKWASAQKVYVTLGTASTNTTIQGGSTSAQTIGVNGTLKITNGGTGATSASGARTNLELDNLATTHLYYSSTQPSSGMKTGDLWLKPKT